MRKKRHGLCQNIPNELSLALKLARNTVKVAREDYGSPRPNFRLQSVSVVGCPLALLQALQGKPPLWGPLLPKSLVI